MAMMAMTTRSSMRVNPFRPAGNDSGTRYLTVFIAHLADQHAVERTHPPTREGPSGQKEVKITVKTRHVLSTFFHRQDKRLCVDDHSQAEGLRSFRERNFSPA